MNKPGHQVTATAPASIGNFIVGFDTLGVAIESIGGHPLADRVSARILPASEQTRLQLTGPFAGQLPAEAENNLVYCAYQAMAELIQQQARSMPPMALLLEKNLPIGSGLGSSAASIVAAVAAINALLDQHLDQEQALQLCGRLEAGISGSLHLDNIAPSYLGGAVICHSRGIRQLRLPQHWRLVVAYSGETINTRDMREILPPQVLLATAAAQVADAMAFVAALGDGDDQALSYLQDRLAEPHRADKISGYAEAKSHCLSLGAKAVGISGSGPTLCAICTDTDSAAACQNWLQQHYRVNQTAFCRLCRVSNEGFSLYRNEQELISP